jgi:hypothetical protein
MLDAQNQGPQCTACGSPMKLSANEPSSTGTTCEHSLARNAEGSSGTSLKAQ